MDMEQWDKVAAALQAVDYPANRQDLVNHARQARTDEQTVAVLRALPVGIYRNLVDVRLRSDTQAAAGPGPDTGAAGHRTAHVPGTDPGSQFRRQK
jgi:hypothetical protein